MPVFSDVTGRVHAAVQHALDKDFVVGEGVEGDVLANELRPVARPNGVALLSAFWFCAALLQPLVELVEIAVGLVLTELSVAPSPNLA